MQLRPFISAIEVKHLVTARGRVFTDANDSLMAFGCAITPSGRRAYPKSYIEAFLAYSAGPIYPGLILGYNQSRGTDTFREARRNFEQLCSHLAASLPHGGYLSLDQAGWLLGVTRSAVEGWWGKGAIRVAWLNGVRVVHPDNFINACTWQLPTE